MNIYLLVFLSFVIGTVYYYIMESSIPRESNCSFISSIWTDILAFFAGKLIPVAFKLFLRCATNVFNEEWDVSEVDVTKKRFSLFGFKGI